MPANVYQVIPFSFVVGLLIGVTSMGGAALMTPFLVLGLGIRPVVAVGTDLVYGAVTKVAGAWMHCRQRTVDYWMVLHMACGSVPGGILGVFSIRALRRFDIDPDVWVKEAIGIGLVVVAVILVIRALRGRRADEPNPWLLRHRRASATAWGFVVGFVVGLTSLGSGTLIIPFLLSIYPSRPARAVGTDVFHGALLVAATGGLHAGEGHVDWGLLPPLLAGSVPGVLLGSYLAPRLPVRPLRVGIGLILFASGVKLV